MQGIKIAKLVINDKQELLKINSNNILVKLDIITDIIREE